MKIRGNNYKFNNITFGNSKVNTLYFNDFHSNINHLDSLKTAYDEFKKVNQNTPNFVFSGGDNFLDRSENNPIVNKAMNEILDATAVGNHDIEGKKHFFDLASKSKFHWLASNVNYLKKAQQILTNNPVKKSVILESNGEKVGVIGAAPMDYAKLAFIKKGEELTTIKNLEKTVASIRKEVEKLEAQGIDKIFLLAHTGKQTAEGADIYDSFAKIGGIDVIIGGHDHKQVDRWTRSLRNEPVKIVATGRTDTKKFNENLDEFGVLNLTFDDFGVLIPNESKNIFKKTTDFPKTDFVSKFQDKADFETIYTIRNPLECEKPLAEENKTANIVADSNLWYVNAHTEGEKAQFAFVNAGTIRGNFDKTDINVNEIKKVVPFTTSMLIKTTLTKKQIFDTLNWCVESTKFPKIVPGLMQVSGMKYTVGKDLKVKDVFITDVEGNPLQKLDDLPDDTKFTCVYDDFLATGVAGLSELKKELVLEEIRGNLENFNVSRQIAMKDYLDAFKGKEIYDFESQRIMIE